MSLDSSPTASATIAPGARPPGMAALLAAVSRMMPDADARMSVLCRAEAIAHAAGQAIRADAAASRMREHLAGTDGLTGLLNSRGLAARLSEHLAQARRHNEQGAVLFCVMEGLARIAQHLGGSASDAALRMIGGALRAQVRAHDAVGHLGSGRFAVLMNRIGKDQGLTSAARLGRAVGRLTLVHEGMAVPLAVTIGLAPFTGTESAKELLSAGS